VHLAHAEEAAEGVDVVDLAVQSVLVLPELVHHQHAGVVDEHVELAEALLRADTASRQACSSVTSR
jgi:hypothetical protein